MENFENVLKSNGGKYFLKSVYATVGYEVISPIIAKRYSSVITSVFPFIVLPSVAVISLGFYFVLSDSDNH